MSRPLEFWRGVSLLLLGVLIGLLIAFAARPRPFGGLGPGRGAPWRRPLMLVMEHRLGLSPGQRDSLAAILERHRRVLEAERRAFVERIRPERDSLFTEVRAILTPEQQKRFDRIARRWEREGRGRGGPD